MKKLFLGIMTGTSLDAMDISLVELNDAQCNPIASRTYTLPEQLKARLNLLIQTPMISLQELGELDVILAKVYARACTSILDEFSITPDQICAIGCHGQTIFHQPDAEHCFSMQIGSGAWLAELTTIPVVTDFRNNDIALGGQGAPLVCAFHKHLISKPDNQVFINLGGIANITYITPGSDVVGFDTGPANTLMDLWYQTHHSDGNFDIDGSWAASGDCSETLLNLMLNDPYFQKPAPKSTGREYFHLQWLNNKLADSGLTLAASDVQATLLELTSVSIGRSLDNLRPEHVYVCGGGVKNPELIKSLTRALNRDIKTTAELGVDPDYMESIAFAWLASQRLEEKTASLASVTGSIRSAVTGALYLPSPPC